MNERAVRLLIGSFLMMSLSGIASAAAPGATDVASVRQRLPDVVVPFEGNRGHVDARVAYSARTLEGTLFVTRDGQIVHSLPGKVVGAKRTDPMERALPPKRGAGWTLSETLVDARPRPAAGTPSAV